MPDNLVLRFLSGVVPVEIEAILESGNGEGNIIGIGIVDLPLLVDRERGNDRNQTTRGVATNAFDIDPNGATDQPQVLIELNPAIEPSVREVISPAGLPRSQARRSVRASTWQEAQETWPSPEVSCVE